MLNVKFLIFSFAIFKNCLTDQTFSFFPSTFALFFFLDVFVSEITFRYCDYFLLALCSS